MRTNVIKKLLTLSLFVIALFCAAGAAGAARAAESEINSATKELVGANIDFPDLQYDDLNAKAARWFARNNIVSGYADGTFRPTRYITRAEFLKLLCVTLGYDASVSDDVAAYFSDVSPSHWAFGYIARMVGEGLALGDEAGRFFPDSYISYDDIFGMLLPYMVSGEYSTGANSVERAKAAFASGLAKSLDYSVLAQPDEYATRLLAVRLLYNTGIIPPPALLDDLSGNPFETDITSITKQCKVDVSSIPSNCDVYYTLGGDTPTTDAQLYESSFFINSSSVVSFVTVNRNTGRRSPVSVFEYILPEGEDERNTAMASNIKARTAEIADELIKPEMSEKEKALAIYRWVNKNKNGKSSILAEIWAGPENASLDGYGVYYGYGDGVIKCGTFAMAYRDLARYAGLEADIVLGYSPSNERHAWNVVKIDGVWYYLDTGWGYFGKTPVSMARLGYTVERNSGETSLNSGAHAIYTPMADRDIVTSILL
jgi:hypothetical protein